jgi:hypothetical protein
MNIDQPREDVRPFGIDNLVRLEIAPDGIYRSIRDADVQFGDRAVR